MDQLNQNQTDTIFFKLTRNHYKIDLDYHETSPNQLDHQEPLVNF